jgi:anti-sigma regulatory factor (Ser/Thr protein kinase)
MLQNRTAVSASVHHVLVRDDPAAAGPVSKRRRVRALQNALRLNEPAKSAHVLRVAIKKTKIQFSSHTVNLAFIRNGVRDFLKGYPFSEKQRLLMVLGVDEACTNVIRYAYRLRDDQVISLRMEGLRKCVRMRLRDYGEQVLLHEMKGRSHDMIKPGGLGLFLIRYAFDEVDYIHKRRGTELVLTKNFT